MLYIKYSLSRFCAQHKILTVLFSSSSVLFSALCCPSRYRLVINDDLQSF